MADMMRVASLSGYHEAMAALGVDPRALLREQGLTPELLADPEQLMPARAAIRLLESSASEAGCTTLGLRMAEGRALANLGVTSLLIAHQPTLRRALAAIREFRQRINSTLVLQVEEGTQEAILREDLALRQPEPARQSSNLALGVLMRLCSSVLGEDWRPQGVCFSHQPPPAHELPIFTRLFRCRPQFNSEINGIIVRTADLDRPNARADHQLARHARQLLEAVATPGERTAAQDVDQVIRLLLPSGRATIQTCAASLGVTVRTLQRRLDAEGESFTALLNAARMQLATQYLANPRLRITDIAEMTGYRSIGAFSRWHLQAFGQPARQTRRQR